MPKDMDEIISATRSQHTGDCAGEHKDKGIIELELRKILLEMLDELKAIHELLDERPARLGRLGGQQ